MRKIQIIGNVTKDAEVRNIASGKSVINFDVAVNERWKDKSGVQQTKTTYVKCAIWRDNTTIRQYIKKGIKLYIEGTPEVEAYINKEGNAIGNLKINVLQLEFLSSLKSSGTSSGEDTSQSPSVSNDSLVPTPDDDLPF